MRNCPVRATVSVCCLVMVFVARCVCVGDRLLYVIGHAAVGHVVVGGIVLVGIRVAVEVNVVVW